MPLQLINMKITLDEYLFYLKNDKKLDSRTITSYCYDVKGLLSWSAEKKNPELDTVLLREYLTSLEATKKPSTLQRKYRALCSFMDYLIKIEELKPQPFIYKPPKAKRSEPKKLSGNEIERLLSILETQYQNASTEFQARLVLRDQIIMKLLFYHSLEISAITRLQVKDYVAEEHCFLLSDKKGNLVRIPLFSPSLILQLEIWLKERLWMGNTSREEGALFVTKLGTPVSSKMAILIFDKYKDLAGIAQEATPKLLKYSAKEYARQLFLERCS